MNAPTAGIDAEYDVIIIGFGAAGACAAIEAAGAGLSVLALDRYYAGGASILSGGVVYAGGGTPHQIASGIQDSPANMFDYLKHEIPDADEEVLRDFTASSTEMIRWLEDRGVVFGSNLCPYKTSYPTNRHYLYYSGNEQVHKDVAMPAARGHRALGKHFSGAPFFRPLRDAALHAGTQLVELARVTDLTFDNGRVTGVRCRVPAVVARFDGLHRRLWSAASKMQNWYPPVGRVLTALSERTAPPTTELEVRARVGVVICGGGFAHSQAEMRRHAPAYLGATALGTVADDGGAIDLGRRVGAAVDHMSNISGWRFLTPPSVLVRGVLVDEDGRRIGNEQAYGATLSERMVSDHGGRGFLITDRSIWKAARDRVPRESTMFHLPQMAYLFSWFGHQRADSLSALARRIGVDEASLYKSLDAYNTAIRNGLPDEFGKHDDARRPLATPPYYAIDCSLLNSALYPFLYLTLGGLVVDQRSGTVLRADDSAISGLYAAGRSAVGLCSTGYISGLSLADAVYSGRRAGRHLAMRSGASRAT